MTNRLLLNTRAVSYASLYAIENSYRALHLPVSRVSAMILWISLCLATSPRLSPCTRHVSWHFTPLVNIGKFSNFTREYLRVITRGVVTCGLSRVCEVIVELYRMLISDRLSVSANVRKSISVNRNIGKISYQCITNCFSR